MLKIIILSVCLWAISNASEEPNSNTRIVGGDEINISRAPYQVAIFHDDEFSCGGTVIGKRCILTAAHCTVLYDPDKTLVVAGTTELDNLNGLHIYGVSVVYFHPDYVADSYKNDIGMIVLKENIDFSDGSVKYISAGVINVPIGAKLFVSGWGRTAANEPISNHLKGLTVTAVSEAFCRFEFPDKMHGNQICTYEGVGRGTCKGDSGGPLVYKNNVVGVVSFGRVCAVGVGDIFTSVAHFQEYINYFLQKYG